MHNRRALISVWNKEGVPEFCSSLVSGGWELVSSSGTAKALKEANLPVTEVETLTGYPHILGGRVKTLHPAVFGGILARRDFAGDLEDVEKFDIPLFDLVLCTLYPFEEKAREGQDLATLLEHIDIGGVTLIRGAAKNYPHVIVLTDTGDCGTVMEELRAYGDVSLPTRQKLALKAFRKTSLYDATILEGLEKALGSFEDVFEEEAVLGLRKEETLRYGENPHQEAALYLPPLKDLPWTLLGGKPLSYNNIIDLDAVLRGASLFSGECACTIVKHTTPCGIALGKTPEEAFQKAYNCDSLSAFGGVVSFTRPLDENTCRLLGEHFIEIVVAPDFDSQGLEYLRERRPNLRIIRWQGGRISSLEIRSTWSGYLVQQDRMPELPSPEKGSWIGTERKDLWEDLLFAWKTVALCKSNAIAVIKDGETLGMGRGFTSRVDAVTWALKQAGEKARGAILASDAFFPFPDSVEKAAEAGISAIIQPGGSKKDPEVVQAAERLGITMFLSGWRTFRH
ncbi:MAG TPA: bifunctional phosphoribosylaminoimidazolecarboxamide formyltransferase/IMP cyclohydrolase [Synergistaceae bacterium]|mgnify:CR=1 FL=1|nr:bifunctional phosphoribosylaminoimidazolecarboxamide formyltransferase/IMP cyclohydrolase [Synergistaceae bacterium]HPJ24969.1 bifunctional phosphoribosylaminoimidazolecarboxamide formyltransferase/IMP cyclohydrolase [Synergistaceae bacterium]HPQ36825.1 bifunctional phosphoribosylaminoimidazolecarboxamide formyltransferase/IMP cyclohydrolase [Synergistaceae bacterium]